MAKDAVKKIMTPEFRVAFPSVFVPRDPMKGSAGEPKYELVAIFPVGTDLSALKTLARDAAKEKWGDKIPETARNPFRNGSERADSYEGFEKDSFFITLKSKFQPGIVDAELIDIINPKDFYGGCWARATVNAYAYENSGNKGVAFSVNNIQKTRDGAPFTKRVSAAQEFTKVDGPAAPAAGGDDFLG